MAGFYETLIQSVGSPYAPAFNSVFGNVATSSKFGLSNKDYTQYQKAVDSAQSNLNKAQNQYTSYLSKVSPKSSNLSDIQANTEKYRNNIANAQSALTKAQGNLANEIGKQSERAGGDAVTWGLAAKSAEQAGLNNANNMYQNGLMDEVIRNGIMNQAINSIGFGGGKNG